jgi:hypothetical protein
MKYKICICIAVLFLSINVIGQNETTVTNTTDSQAKSLKVSDDNELRINLLMSIIGLPEINYERYIADNMGVGLAVSFSLDTPENMSFRSIILPYYRLYFGSKKANGFFIEGNMAIVGQNEISYNYYPDGTSYSRSSTNFGFGFAAGEKFLTRNGFIGEVYLGLGRLFGESINGAYPRVGVCLGKRF